MPKLIDLTGERFGRLIVLNLAGRSKNRQTIWLCLCECGNKTKVRRDGLISGKTSSCGCRGRESNLTHGHARNTNRSMEYVSWVNMKVRCKNVINEKFNHYRGKGVIVCDRWKNSFENFLSDMGPRPNGTTLDRIDNNGIYEPSNCRWANQSLQSRNKSNSRNWFLHGLTFETAEEAAKHFFVNRKTIGNWCGINKSRRKAGCYSFLKYPE